MLMLKIFLDVETLPPEMTEEQLENFKADLKHPANLKDPEKIKKWYEDNMDKKYRDLAKKSSSATVATMAFGFGDKEVEGIFSPDREEKELLEQFNQSISDEIASQLDDESDIDEATVELVFIGYNCRKFDLDLIWKRAKYYKLHELADRIPRERYSKNVIDLMEVFQGANYNEYISQDAVCKYFGIKGKPDDIDGSQVYDYWQRGEYEKIVEYNIDDVEKVKELYKIMVE